jgi:hypothetical protein
VQTRKLTHGLEPQLDVNALISAVCAVEIHERARAEEVAELRVYRDARSLRPR